MSANPAPRPPSDRPRQADDDERLVEGLSPPMAADVLAADKALSALLGECAAPVEIDRVAAGVRRRVAQRNGRRVAAAIGLAAAVVIAANVTLWMRVKEPTVPAAGARYVVWEDELEAELALTRDVMQFVEQSWRQPPDSLAMSTYWRINSLAWDLEENSL